MFFFSQETDFSKDFSGFREDKNPYFFRFGKHKNLYFMGFPWFSSQATDSWQNGSDGSGFRFWFGSWAALSSASSQPGAWGSREDASRSVPRPLQNFCVQNCKPPDCPSFPWFRRTVLESSRGPCYQRDLPMQGIFF